MMLCKSKCIQLSVYWIWLSIEYWQLLLFKVNGLSVQPFECNEGLPWLHSVLVRFVSKRSKQCNMKTRCCNFFKMWYHPIKIHLTIEHSYDRHKTHIRQMLLLYDWGLMIALYPHLSFFFECVCVCVGVGAYARQLIIISPHRTLYFHLTSPCEHNEPETSPMGINFLAFCVAWLAKLLRVLYTNSSSFVGPRLSSFSKTWRMHVFSGAKLY